MEKLKSETDRVSLAFDRVTALWKERTKQWSDGQQTLQHLMRRRLASSLAASSKIDKLQDWRFAPSFPPFTATADAAKETIPLSKMTEKNDVVDTLLPLRTRLRTRKSRKCDACDKFLIKPETKMNSTSFKIRSMAMSSLSSSCNRMCTEKEEIGR